jgi:hypothetical protein
MAPKEISKRPDRAKKLAERRITQETVVKCSIRKLLVPQSKQKVMEAIHSRVAAYSKRMHIASLSMNLIIKELCEGVDTKLLYDLHVPNIFSQTFIRQLMLGTKGTVLPQPEVETLYARYPRLLQKLTALERHSADRNIYSSGAIKYLTNLKNHYTTNTLKWIKKFVYSQDVKKRLQLDDATYKSATKVMLYYLCNWKLSDDDIDTVSRFPRRIKNLLKRQKKILGSEQIDKQWFKNADNLPSMLRYCIFINRYKQETKEGKLTNLAPVCGIRNHFMTLDTHSLYGVIKDLKQTMATEETFKGFETEEWAAILNTDCIRGKETIFTNTIETDGTSVCVHFKRPKNIQDDVTKKNKATTLLKDPNVVVVGIDPGRTQIIHAVIEQLDGSFKSVILTRRQYYNESGITDANASKDMWQRYKPLHEALVKMSQVSSKGTSVEDFNRYLDVIFETYDVQWSEYTKRKWSDQRLRLYGGKKRVFANFFNKLQTVAEMVQKDARIVIAYGAAKVAPGGKGEVCVPTHRAYKECCYRFPTVAVDEFRTSRVHWETDKLLKSVMRRDKKQEIRGLLWCCSTNQVKSKFVNRDQNAAINIRRCLTSKKRPVTLTRSKDLKPLGKKVVGRTIKC